MKLEILGSPTLFKVHTIDKKLWAGTFKTKKEADDCRKQLRDKSYIVTEIDMNGKPVEKSSKQPYIK